MPRIEWIDEKYEKSLNCNKYKKLLYDKNDRKSQEGQQKSQNLFASLRMAPTK